MGAVSRGDSPGGHDGPREFRSPVHFALRGSSLGSNCRADSYRALRCLAAHRRHLGIGGLSHGARRQSASGGEERRSLAVRVGDGARLPAVPLRCPYVARAFRGRRFAPARDACSAGQATAAARLIPDPPALIAGARLGCGPLLFCFY